MEAQGLLPHCSSCKDCMINKPIIERCSLRMNGKSKVAKDPKGKRATDIVLVPSFWNAVVCALMAMRSLERVLGLVDNEKRPAMGYIYEAMDKAKEAIQKTFNGDESKYKEIFAVIDRRWECQHHHPLHATVHYLNSEFFYNNQETENDAEVLAGHYKCIAVLSPNTEIIDRTSLELAMYKCVGDIFGLGATIRQIGSCWMVENVWSTYTKFATPCHLSIELDL